MALGIIVEKIRGVDVALRQHCPDKGVVPRDVQPFAAHPPFPWGAVAASYASGGGVGGDVAAA